MFSMKADLKNKIDDRERGRESTQAFQAFHELDRKDEITKVARVASKFRTQKE